MVPQRDSPEINTCGRGAWVPCAVAAHVERQNDGLICGWVAAGEAEILGRMTTRSSLL
jgi:hypothetical protein